MRRATALLLLFISIAIEPHSLPLRAQGPFTPDEQAALADIRAAIQQHDSSPAYAAAISQKVEQSYFETFAGRTHTLIQTSTIEGTLESSMNTGTDSHTQQLELVRTVRTANQGKVIGEGEDTIQIQIRASGDRVSLRVEAPTALQALYPSGWVDLPADTSQWLGLDFLDVAGLTAYGRLINPASLEPPYQDVRSVEILEPTIVGGRVVNHYRVGIAQRLIPEAFGAKSLAGMFVVAAPFDLSAYINLLITDENTRFTAEISIFADDHSLHSYNERVETDINIPEEYALQSPGPGTEYRVVLDLMESLVFDGVVTEN